MKPLVVVALHNIRSAHNVGSIFRTADAAGCKKLYLCGVTPGPFDRFGRPNPKIAKIALGAEQYLPSEHKTSTVKLLQSLRRDGYEIIAIEQHSRAQSIYKVRLSRARHKRYALVLAEEEHGLSPTILRHADRIVEIPMRGKKESLNVSVAFGVAVFQLLR